MEHIGVGPLGGGELVQPGCLVCPALAGARPALGLVVLRRNLALPGYQGGALVAGDEGGALLPAPEVPLVGGDVAGGSHDGLWCLDSGLDHPACPPDSSSVTKLL